jgi:hypothetical protein
VGVGFLHLLVIKSILVYYGKLIKILFKFSRHSVLVAWLGKGFDTQPS